MRIFPPESDIADNEGFTSAKDMFGRAGLGQGLTNLLGAVTSPTVLAIDGQWGSGKTTFLRMWAGQLRAEGFPVIYFDAFENDYVDDAFSVLAGEITALVGKLHKENEPRSKVFVARAIGAGKVLARSALKVGIKAATLGALDAADFTDLGEALSSEAESLTDKYIGELITKQAERKDTIEAFRAALKDLPAVLSPSPEDANNKPLVFILDELDRCKPTFALALLERMKHFFAVENVHFVLGAHLGQLRNSVKAAYGSDIDAHSYLQKFIHIVFPLVDTAAYDNDRITSKYIRHLAGSLEFPSDSHSDLDTAVGFIGRFSKFRELSLRDVERIMSNVALAFAFTQQRTLRPGPVIAGLSILRVLRPDLYAQAKGGRLSYADAEAALGLDNRGRGRGEEDKGYSEWEVGWWLYGLNPEASPAVIETYDRGLSSYNLRERFALIPLIANGVVDRLVPYQ